MKIAVVAPSCRLSPEAARKVEAIAVARGDCELRIHPQCFLSDGHFAGSDAARSQALLEVLADASVDAVWAGRGGYGSNRIAEAVCANLPATARDKLYMGYSDSGFLLAGLHKAGMAVAHGPMVQDVMRDGGDAAIGRALDWLVRRDASALEPGLGDRPSMAFNVTVLSHLLGTALEPDFTGVDLLLEEVSEHDYRLDRAMFHLARSPAIARAAAIRLGRVSDVPDNDPPFGRDGAAIVADWCARSAIALGAPADIGHDAANKVVPFPHLGR